MGVAKLHAIFPVFIRKIMKKFWLKFSINAKFCAKNIYLLRMIAEVCAKLVSFWCKNDVEFFSEKIISHKTTLLFLQYMCSVSAGTLYEKANRIMFLLSFLQTQWPLWRIINQNAHVSVWSYSKLTGFQQMVEWVGWWWWRDIISIYLYFWLKTQKTD